MKNCFKHGSIILALIMLMTMQFTFAFASDGQNTSVVGAAKGQIVILHTNDVHSRVDDKLGYASVKGWKDYFQAQGSTVLLLDAGDSLHGYPIANLGQGENIVEIMNAVGYTAMTPGNHDFNYGIKRLLELKKEMTFDLLSANLTAENGSAVLSPSKLYEQNGVKIGIIGISTPETATKTNPDNVKGYSFNESSMADQIQTQIDKLEKEGADYIIGLGHLGMDKESAPFRSIDIIEKLHGLDIFIDGHSHTTLENGQLVKDKDGHNVVLAQTGNYLDNIGKVTIDNGRITASLIKEARTDAAIKNLVDDKKTEIQPMLDTVVAKTEVELDGEREPGVRTKETNLGDLAADAIKYAAGADIALTNGGGIRTSIKQGNITYGDLNSVFPFGNTVVTIEIKGKDLLAALEHGTKNCPEASGGFPQVSGLSFEINTAASQNRVQNVKIGDAALDLNKSYKLATNDFTQAGGDGYTMLAEYVKTGEYGALDEALVNYIQKTLKGAVDKNYAAPQGRITMTAQNKTETVEYTDITKHWAKSSIINVVDKGLFKGTDSNKFSPNGSMTRAMFITTLGRLQGVDTSAYTASSFSDVNIQNWYGGYVEWASEKGIASGEGVSSAENKPYFAPDRPITREEMAVILMKYCDSIGEGPKGEWAVRLDYTDLNQMSQWANEGIMYCSMKGYISGYTDGSFAPKKTATRAEVAAILDRFISRNNEKTQ
ncbi:5'-nucleotidase C-terminal domain-containing protein [Aminipila sp.]|uniref:5'-nucleotidase C-terminal domain-containing protein n=1 Tax=Aminipila sp. TaxID=2060095 RepID=UPI00289732E9|nr:5'-nucleotidase C-terminal domain-containing protein [Aminipila sp.]